MNILNIYMYFVSIYELMKYYTLYFIVILILHIVKYKIYLHIP